MRRLLLWWVDFWDRREGAESMALVRIFMGLVILWDVGLIGPLGLVDAMFGMADQGGIADLTDFREPPLLFELFDPSPGVARGIWLTMLASALCFALGLGTRLAGLVLILTWAQWAIYLPWADRGIDMLMRNVVFLLIFSGSHKVWSLDALIRTRSWRGDGTKVPAWPRYLLIIQLIIVYFAAGVSKVASSWLPVGDWSALYIAMRDPAFAKLPPEIIRTVYPLTQLGTVVSWTWEWTSPVLLLAFWYRETRTRPGRLRALFNRIDFVKLFLLVGATFHVGTHLALQLGIFPFAMMSLYPACFHPEETRRMLKRLPLGRRPR